MLFLVICTVFYIYFTINPALKTLRPHKNPKKTTKPSLSSKAIETKLKKPHEQNTQTC